MSPTSHRATEGTALSTHGGGSVHVSSGGNVSKIVTFGTTVVVGFSTVTVNETVPEEKEPVLSTVSAGSGGPGSGTAGRQMLPKNGLPGCHPPYAVPPPLAVRASPGAEYATWIWAQNGPSPSVNGTVPVGNADGGTTTSYVPEAAPVALYWHCPGWMRWVKGSALTQMCDAMKLEGGSRKIRTRNVVPSRSMNTSPMSWPVDPARRSTNVPSPPKGSGKVWTAEAGG